MSYKRLTYCDAHEDVIVSYQYEYGCPDACPLCDALKKVGELEGDVEDLKERVEEALQGE